MDINEILRCIEDEPELPGDPPPEMLESLIAAITNKDADLLIECLRIVVKIAKDNISKRVMDLDNISSQNSVQTFEITRAPEEPTLTSHELHSLIWHARPKSEWGVRETTVDLEATFDGTSEGRE